MLEDPDDNFLRLIGAVANGVPWATWNDICPNTTCPCGVECGVAWCRHGKLSPAVGGVQEMTSVARTPGGVAEGSTARARLAVHSTDPLVAALAYAAMGWPVFSLHAVRDGRCICFKSRCDNAGKHPSVKWTEQATTDPSTIQRWWGSSPVRGIGVVTGPEADLTVLDVDGDDGEESLFDLQCKYEPLPDTIETITGSGGRHLFFHYHQALTTVARRWPNRRAWRAGNGRGPTQPPRLWPTIRLGTLLRPRSDGTASLPEWMARTPTVTRAIGTGEGALDWDPIDWGSSGATQRPALSARLPVSVGGPAPGRGRVACPGSSATVSTAPARA